MSNGVADKNYYWLKNKDTKDRYVNSLKAVLVPGEWMRERMLKSKHISLPAEAIIPVGWPRLDLLRELQSDLSVPDVKSQVRYYGHQYIINWKGGAMNVLPLVILILKKMLRV